MKQWLANSVAIVLAVCFVWAGSGVNAVRYCCSECRHAGIEHVLNHSCDRVHHHGDQTSHSDSRHASQHNPRHCHHGDGCTFTRLEVSDGGISHAIQVPEAAALDVLAWSAAIEEELLLATANIEEYTYENTRHTIPITGRSVSICNRSILI